MTSNFIEINNHLFVTNYVILYHNKV